MEMSYGEGGVKIRVSMPDEVIDPKLAALVGEYQETKVVDTMDEFNKLIDPIKNTIAKANDMIDKIREERGIEGEDELELIGNQSFQLSKRA